MLSWDQFIKFREHDEKREEKNGLDTDHDHEKGESAKHKEAVKKAKKRMLEFFEKRKEGAARIASEARSKGGPALLTAWHFAAKAAPYREVISAIRSDKSESYFIQKYISIISKLKVKNLKQENFQKLMGEAEVWGEALAELWNS